MFRMSNGSRNGRRAVLLGGLALLAFATVPAAAVAGTAAQPTPRQVSNTMPYVIRHVSDGDRVVPAGWSKEPTAVVTWGGYLPPGQTESWVLPSVGLTDVDGQSRQVFQIRNGSAEGQCVAADAARAQAYLRQRACSVNDPTQKWLLIPTETGTSGTGETVDTGDTTAYRIAPLGDPDLAVAPQEPWSHWSYLWLVPPGADAAWTFDPYPG